jgi:enoyl-CoA hydratase/carnithine racemase
VEEELATYRIDGHVAIVGLNRPSKLNAINQEMKAAASDALQRAENDPECRSAAGRRPQFLLRL